MNRLLSKKLLEIDDVTLAFYCPGCDTLHPLGKDIPNSKRPRWVWDGNVDKPTFHPSIHSQYRFNNEQVVCHSFLIEGRIRYLSDCTHALKGQIVDLPDIPEEWL